MDSRKVHQARCVGRSAAAFDLSISANAVRLYLAIDEHAGASGVAWPGQHRLMVMTGLSRRQFFRALGELRDKHMTISKDKRRAIYTLKWVPRAAPISLDRCQNEQEWVPPAAPIDRSILYEPVLREPGCEICGGNGWAQNPAFGGMKLPCECETGQAIKARLSQRRRA